MESGDHHLGCIKPCQERDIYIYIYIPYQLVIAGFLNHQSTVSWGNDLELSYYREGTPWKINIEPENDGLEDDFPFPGVYSQVPC